MNEEERQVKLANLSYCREQGEKFYDEMYEVHSFGSAAVCYHDAKECFQAAIRLAEELGALEEADSIRKRLEHITAVFRSQFAQ
jgi:hypothetical protein